MAEPPFGDELVEQLARIIGATSGGLTGTQIARALDRAHISDPGLLTKSERIYTALAAEQARTGSGNCVVVFLKTVFKPERWIGHESQYEDLLAGTNKVLAFAALAMGRDGQMARRAKARTHADVAATARRLRDAMTARGGHAEVFRYCAPELLTDDFFGAVFEAIKGLGDRLREMTGLDEDGSRLVDAALCGANPVLALNALNTLTLRNEQTGIASIMKGLFSAFRNPSAHEPRLVWHVDEQDALDVLSTISLLHRKLDRAVVIPRTHP